MSHRRPSGFDSFFKNYSENVDNADNQAFWRFSDAIVEELICKHLPVERDCSVLDAGGGTGRWISRIFKRTQRGIYTLYDLSPHMLEKANARFEKEGISERVSVQEVDLQHLETNCSESFDFIFSTYGVISFVEQPQLAVDNLAKALKKGGKMMLMGHGFHNAIASKVNNYLSASKEVEELANTSIVKWAKYVPPLHTFSLESLSELIKNSGLTFETAYGVPIYIQPGPEDFDPTNKQVSDISRLLEDSENFNRLLEIEMKFNEMPSLINRGVNTIIVASKT